MSKVKRRQQMENAKKIFLSIPFRNKSSAEIDADWDEAVHRVEAFLNEPVSIISSKVTILPPEYLKSKELWYLGGSLQLLAQADIAYFGRGWRDARGCVIEHDAAIAYGVPFILYEDTEEIKDAD